MRASLLVAAAVSMLVLVALIMGRGGDLRNGMLESSPRSASSALSDATSELAMSTRSTTASVPPPAAAHTIGAGLTPSRAPSQKAAPGKLSQDFAQIASHCVRLCFTQQNAQIMMFVRAHGSLARRYYSQRFGCFSP